MLAIRTSQEHKTAPPPKKKHTSYWLRLRAACGSDFKEFFYLFFYCCWLSYKPATQPFVLEYITADQDASGLMVRRTPVRPRY